jgi:uncharacterized protein (DUF2236 family)
MKVTSARLVAHLARSCPRTTMSTERRHADPGVGPTAGSRDISRRGDAFPLDRPLGDPGGVAWRVNREAVTMLGGGRALLMQVAHPLVAAGVAAHSRFQREPLARLFRTLELMLTIAFADGREALAAVATIQHVHRRVRGRLAEDVGPFPRGTPYDAADPELMLWVHATLVDSALVAYETFVGPLSSRARGAYYAESTRTARLFGIPDALVPPTLGDFRRYVRATLKSDALTIGADGRALAAAILRPPLPVGLHHLFRAGNLVTIGLLPPTLRRRYGLGWSAVQQLALDALASGVRATLPFLPAIVRHVPQARTAAAGPGRGGGRDRFSRR